MDPTQGAFLSVKNMQVYVKPFIDNIPPFIDFWVIPHETCPRVAFELPNSTDYSFTLHTSSLKENFCSFPPKYSRNLTQNIYYGVSSFISMDPLNFSASSASLMSAASYQLSLKSSVSDSSTRITQLLLYSSNKKTFMNPIQICHDLFCRVDLSFPSFFQLRNLRAKTSASATDSALYFRLIGGSLSRSHSSSQVPFPMPFYNFSGKYSFGSEFDLKKIEWINDGSDGGRRKRERTTVVVSTVLGAVLMALAVLLKAFIEFYIVKANKGLGGSQEAVEKRPLTVVLNRYCPKTSAVLISSTN